MANMVVNRVLELAAQVRGDAHGQGMAEYGLILALVAVVVVGAVTLLGGNISSAMNSVAGSI
jgi:pilus assembly protein Flp/PilA